MKINPTKTETTLLTNRKSVGIMKNIIIQNQTIQTKTAIKYLGFHVDRTFMFKRHVNDRVPKNHHCCKSKCCGLNWHKDVEYTVSWLTHISKNFRSRRTGVRMILGCARGTIVTDTNERTNILIKPFIFETAKKFYQNCLPLQLKQEISQYAAENSNNRKHVCFHERC